MAIIERKSIKQPSQLIEEIPISKEILSQIERHRKEAENILSGKSKRWLVILGPCSAWPSAAVLEYGLRLSQLAEEVKDSLLLVMRSYIQKPRTTKGWTGPLNQPDPFQPPDIEAGMIYCRKMMKELLEIGLPLADEALFTHNATGFADLLSWIAVGARSSEDQEHRIFASMVDCPVGMKNPTSGSIEIGVNSILAAQHGHTFVLDGHQVMTSGNPHAHLVLRGGSVTGPNYHPRFIHEAAKRMRGLENPAIVIDASHDNAVVNGEKNPRQQVHVVEEVLGYMADNDPSYDVRLLVRGFMLESYLLPGCQKIDGRKGSTEVNMSGLSVTDPCLGWEDTQALVYKMADVCRKINT